MDQIEIGFRDLIELRIAITHTRRSFLDLGQAASAGAVPAAVASVDPKRQRGSRSNFSVLLTPEAMLSIDSSIPEGYGYGSSTADVVASIRAVAAAHDSG